MVASRAHLMLSRGLTEKEWRALPEPERLKIQKEVHRHQNFLNARFEGRLKQEPYVKGMREDGFLMENLKRKR